MRLWLIIIACGAVTYTTRASFIALGDRIALPTYFERALRYVAPAAFAAISVPLILGGDGFAGLSDDLPRIGAALVAGFAIWRWRSMPLLLVVGMGTLWLATWLT